MKLADFLILTKMVILFAVSVSVVPAQSDKPVTIREIEVTGETDGVFLGLLLEVEVHMYWQFGRDSVQFLGCSGQESGLGGVDRSDVRYRNLSAWFQKPGTNAGRITVADIANKNIFLITSEDDENPCPARYGGNVFIPDDLIGESETFSGKELCSVKQMAFGNVRHLLIGADAVCTTSVDENTLNAPAAFVLRQNYPNPFNPSTTIKYDLAQPVEVKLQIFDMLGRHVRTLVDQRQRAGSYATKWDGRNEQGQNVASGTFIYQLQAGTFVQTRKLALAR